MDRYDRDEPPSIFPQSEDSLDEAWPASSGSSAPYVDRPDVASTRWIGSGDGRGTEARADGPSRRFMVAIGAGGILIIGLVGYVGASVLRIADDPGNAAASATPSTSLEASATPSPSPSPTPLAAIPSSSPGPSPTLRPQPATPLLRGQWATVVTDLVNLRSTPRLVASVVGQAGRGEIVFVIASEAPVDVDGFTWYQVVADPDEIGWVAGHGPTEQLLRSDAPSAELVWCGPLTAAVFDMRDQQLGDEAVVAGLPVPTDLLGRTAASAIELMWGAEFPVCVSLTIAAGTTSAAEVAAFQKSFCAVPLFGAMAHVLGIPDGPGPVSETGRIFNLDDSVLGTFYTDGVQSNIEDVMTVAEMQTQDALDVCFDVSASGSGDDATVETTATTDACVLITDISAATVGLADLEGFWTVELQRTTGSVVADALDVGGPTPIRLSAQMGLQGPFSLQPASIEGC
jgi:hypothetical protein